MKSPWKEIATIVIGALLAGAGYQIIIANNFVSRVEMIEHVNKNSPWMHDRTYVINELSLARTNADKLEALLIESVRIGGKIDMMKSDIMKIHESNGEILLRVSNLEKEKKVARGD